MQIGFHTCTLLAGTLALAACGSGQISLDDGDGETGSDDAGTGDETESGDTGEDSDTGEDTGEDTGDTGEPEELTCLNENGLVPGVLRTEATLARAWMIDGGIETELALTGSGTPEGLFGAAAGDHIAIVRVDGPWNDQDSIVHAFSRGSGELLWTRSFASSGISQIWAAEDGWVAGIASPYLPGNRVGFVMSEQAAFDLPDHEPITAPAQGHVTAYAIDGMGIRRQVGWISLDDQSWQQAMPTPSSVAAFVSEDRHTLEYLALVDGAPVFVTARPGEAEIIELPIEQLEGESLHVVARSGSYRIVRLSDPNDPDNYVHVRVDLEAGDAVLVDPEPPGGWSFFDCYDRRISVDGDGRLYFELRDEATARPWAYDVDADTWTQLGLGLGLVDDINVLAQSQDVLLVEGRAQFQTFCPPTEWVEPPEGALVGDSYQLVRSEPPLTMVLPNYTWQVLIDRHQRCAASVGEAGWEVRALDGSDAVFEVEAGTGQWLWLD